jgi:L-threonate 2-dehydrogenase
MPPPIPGKFAASEDEKLEAVRRLHDGIQLAAAAEAIALGTRAGLDPRRLYSIIVGAAGNSM